MPVSDLPFNSIVRIGLAAFLLACVTGIPTGVQSVMDAAKERGVFSSRCHNASEPAPCPAQEHSLDITSDVMLSFLNSVSLLDGIIVDTLGGRHAIGVFVFIWTLGTSVSGIAASAGIMFGVGIFLAAWGAEGSFLSFLVFHLKQLCPDDATYALFTSLFSGLWDVGVLVSIPAGAFLKIHSIPYWALYMALGLCVGGGLVFYFVTFPKDRSVHSETQRDTAASTPPLRTSYEQHVGNDGEVSSADITRSMSEKCKHVFTDTFAIVKRLVKLRIFWAITGETTATVTLGSFMFSTVGALVAWHGANPHQVDDAKSIFPYFRGIGGFLYFIPGMFVSQFGLHKGICVGLASQIGVLIVICGLSLIGASVEGYSVYRSYVIFILIVYWRGAGFSLANMTSMSVMRPDFGEDVGIVFGLAYTIGGVTSMAVGGFTTHLVDNDPSYFVGAFLVFGLLFIMSHSFLLFEVRRDGKKVAAAMGVLSDRSMSSGCPPRQQYDSDKPRVAEQI